jgi:hypothetical protein
MDEIKKTSGTPPVPIIHEMDPLKRRGEAPEFTADERKKGSPKPAPVAPRTEGYDLSLIPPTEKQKVARALLAQPLMDFTNLNPSDNARKEEELKGLKTALEHLAAGTATREDITPLRQAHDVLKLLLDTGYDQGSTPVSSEVRKQIHEFNAEVERLEVPQREVQLG